MLMRWLVVLLMLTGVACAQSQQPSPSAGEPGKPPQSQASSDQKATAPDTRGTQENPIVVRSIKSKDETADDATEHQQKTTTERWNIIIGSAAVGGAFLQALIFIVMIRTSHRQLRAYVFAEVDERDRPQFDFNVGARFALRGRNRG